MLFNLPSKLDLLFTYKGYHILCKKYNNFLNILKENFYIFLISKTPPRTANNNDIIKSRIKELENSE